MLTTSPVKGELRPQARSRKTNGKAAFLGRVDGRGFFARRHCDLVRAFAAELGGNLTSSQAIRVNQAAVLSVRAELLQAQIARGDLAINDEDLIRISNALSRELIALGLAPALQPCEPPDPLSAYLTRKTGG